MSKGPSYGVVKDLYPDHFHYWHWMWDRVVDGTTTTSFTRDRYGFLEFVECIGPIPPFMTKPTVGRKDHTLGYVPGNFEWQDHADNVSESSLRNKTAKRSEVRSKMTIKRRSNCLLGKCPHLSHQSRRTLSSAQTA